jgi:CRP-like cAMP-binding protein
MPHQLQPLTRKLSAIGALDPRWETALLNVDRTIRDFAADEPIVREGDRPQHVAVVLSGFVYRYKMVDPGMRQIIAFHVAGDMPDLQGLHLDVMDHAVAPSVASRIALIPHAAVFALLKEYPEMSHVLWREALIDGAIFREWTVNVGRRRALSRVAHVFCEVFMKSRAVGLSTAGECPFPLSQGQLADATGLSAVHVNRVLQILRKEQLIRLEDRILSILNWEGLKEVGDFDPAYLHLKRGSDGPEAGDSTARH